MVKKTRREIDLMYQEMEEKLRKTEHIEEMHNKIKRILGKEELAVKMAVLSIVVADQLMDDLEEYGAAMATVARFTHTLVDIMDKHIQIDEEND